MKVALLLSGGVDSSLALRLLRDEGFDVTPFYLKIWLEDELSFLGECPWEEDLSYARAICDQLNLPLEVINLQREYRDAVVAYTISSVKAGRTPNPDILCNSRIKFGVFMDKIGAEFDMIASGHYARVLHQDERSLLFCAPDPIKDQTYFLAGLNQAQLKKAYFPLGLMDKTQVRQLAHEYDLATKARKDSQGICFLGKISFREFIKAQVGEKVGEIREHETGLLLGQHTGFWFYTIGQRQGLRLAGGPWYVVSKDTIQNIVYVSREYYTSDKARSSFFIEECNWIGNNGPPDFDASNLDPSRRHFMPLSANGKENQDVRQQKTLMANDSENNNIMLEVKLRHGPNRHACQIVQSGDQIQVILADNDQGIAPGQFAVFYSGQQCLGGGVII